MKTKGKKRVTVSARRKFPMPGNCGSVDSKITILHALDYLDKTKRRRKGGIKDAENVLWRAYKK